MSDAAKRLAELTGHPVPNELLELLAAYPAELKAWGAKAGFAPRELPLYPDLETMLAYNEEVRAEDIWTAEGPWPKEFLDLGSEIGGDHFALCLSERPARVHRLDHGAGVFRPCSPDLQSFMEALLALARGTAKRFPG